MPAHEQLQRQRRSFLPVAALEPALEAERPHMESLPALVGVEQVRAHRRREGEVAEGVAGVVRRQHGSGDPAKGDRDEDHQACAPHACSRRNRGSSQASTRSDRNVPSARLAEPAAEQPATR